MSVTRLYRSASIGAIAIAAMASFVAEHAQEVPPDDAGRTAASTETIAVTGSRIKRYASDAPVLIVNFSNLKIDASGEVELAEALAELPSLSSEIMEVL